MSDSQYPIPNTNHPLAGQPIAPDEIIFCEALATHQYNLSATARALDLHPTQARRIYAREHVKRYLDSLLEEHREATAYNLIQLGRQAVTNALYDPMPVLKALYSTKSPEEAMAVLEGLPEDVRKTIQELSWDKEGRARIKFVNRQTALELCFKILDADAARALSSSDPGRMSFQIMIGGAKEAVPIEAQAEVHPPKTEG